MPRIRGLLSKEDTMKIKLTAPEGYRYYDTMTDKSYTEVIINNSERDRFTLVPYQADTIITN